MQLVSHTGLKSMWNLFIYFLSCSVLLERELVCALEITVHNSYGNKHRRRSVSKSGFAVCCAHVSLPSACEIVKGTVSVITDIFLFPFVSVHSRAINNRVYNWIYTVLHYNGTFVQRQKLMPWKHTIGLYLSWRKINISLSPIGDGRV